MQWRAPVATSVTTSKVFNRRIVGLQGHRASRVRTARVTAMFTGIVQGKASVEDLVSETGLKRFRIRFPAGRTEGVTLGASVAINGTCLTVTAIDGDVLSFDVMAETLRATSLGGLQASITRTGLVAGSAAAGSSAAHSVCMHCRLDTFFSLRCWQVFRVQLSPAYTHSVTAWGAVSLVSAPVWAQYMHA